MGEDDEEVLKEDISEDGEANTGVGLKTTVAESVGDWGVVDVRAWKSEGSGADLDGEVWQLGVAVEDVTAVGSAVGGARDLGVVGGEDGRAEKEERSTSVGDGGEFGGRGDTVTHTVSTNREGPEALAAVDWHVCDGTSVLGGIDETEVVRTWLALLEIGSEQRLGEGRLDSVEEGGLSDWLNGVDAAESEAKETRLGGVLGERRACGGSGLDCLGSRAMGHCQPIVLQI